jgi:hypothetical protein
LKVIPLPLIREAMLIHSSFFIEGKKRKEKREKIYKKVRVKGIHVCTFL